MFQGLQQGNVYSLFDLLSGQAYGGSSLNAYNKAM